MAELRGLWQAAKNKSLEDFKKIHPISKNPTVDPPKPYPLKFKLNLGPALDNWEKAKATDAKKGEYRKAALKTMALYISEIKAAKDLKTDKGDAGQIMLDALKVIEKKLGTV